MKNTIAYIIVLPVICATIFSTTSFAQANKSGGRNGGNQQDRVRINPEWLDKFSGEGRREDFDQAMKEERAGWRCMLDKRYDEAIHRFKQATEHYQDLPSAYMALGQAIEAQGGSSEDAEAAYRSSIKLNGDDYRAWHKLAAILLTQKKYVPARKALASGLMLSPPPKERRIMERMITTIDSAQSQ